MLTKKQSQGFYWAGFVFILLITLINRRNTFSEAIISLLISPVFYWFICRVMWWIANKIKPVEIKQKAPLRYWFILLWPFVFGVLVAALFSVLSLFIR